MPVYVAVDFHAREQTISWCDTADGEVHRTKLRHQHDDVRKFYEQFKGEVIVAFEASGYSAWFEQMLAELGHTVWLGNAAEICIGNDQATGCVRRREIGAVEIVIGAVPLQDHSARSANGMIIPVGKTKRAAGRRKDT